MRKPGRFVFAAILGLAVLTLSGCMYGSRIKQEGAPSAGDSVALVQNAMELYRSKTGVLPIRNKDTDTPELERYLVNFKKLKDAQILAAVPANAYESGGTAVYVVVRTDSAPRIKLLDLISYQQAGDLQRAVDGYQSEHGGELPLGPQVSPGYYQLDFELLKRKEELIRSPYSPQKLYPVINETGKVGIDYAPEIQRIIRSKALQPDARSDLRELLLDDALFIPACSFPYRWNGEAPVLADL